MVCSVLQTQTQNKQIYNLATNTCYSLITFQYLGDYHGEMSSATFEEWWNEKLLPNIPSNSLIVMDNAPYHSRRKEEYLIQSWTKKNMAEWFDDLFLILTNASKTDLWSIVRHHWPNQPEYYVCR